MDSFSSFYIFSIHFQFFVRPTTKKLVQFEDFYSVFICTVLKFGFEWQKTKTENTSLSFFIENTNNPPHVKSPQIGPLAALKQLTPTALSGAKTSLKSQKKKYLFFIVSLHPGLSSAESCLSRNSQTRSVCLPQISFPLSLSLCIFGQVSLIFLFVYFVLMIKFFFLMGCLGDLFLGFIFVWLISSAQSVSYKYF